MEKNMFLSIKRWPPFLRKDVGSLFIPLEKVRFRGHPVVGLPNKQPLLGIPGLPAV